MNVASLELSKQLYEVSGWGDWKEPGGGLPDWHRTVSDLGGPVNICPKYDLGYLLRKLPFGPDGNGMSFGFAKDKVWYMNFILTGIRGPHMQSSFSAEGDTPEDAVTKLFLELFNQRLIRREGER